MDTWWDNFEASLFGFPLYFRVSKERCILAVGSVLEVSVSSLLRCHLKLYHLERFKYSVIIYYDLLMRFSFRCKVWSWSLVFSCLLLSLDDLFPGVPGPLSHLWFRFLDLLTSSLLIVIHTWFQLPGAQLFMYANSSSYTLPLACPLRSPTSDYWEKPRTEISNFVWVLRSWTMFAIKIPFIFYCSLCISIDEVNEHYLLTKLFKNIFCIENYSFLHCFRWVPHTQAWTNI